MAPLDKWAASMVKNPIAAIGIGLVGTTLLSIATAWYSYHSYRTYLMGSLPITTSSTRYRKDKYGKHLTWDKYSFFVNGRRIVLCSAEFHPWRVPDHTRWEPILREYKAAGFNCIRIYFHWGYHSPNQGIYIFEGNRDMHYLMEICQKLEIFVLAAPGPYICAETQGGGFPIWLLAKKNVRLRHKVNYWYSKYDPEFSKYENQWYGAILPILAQYQITNGKGGCLLALQIENELDEDLKGYPVGLHDHMRNLSSTARRLGITVPLFTNAAIISDSFITRPDHEKKYGRQQFGIDLYGFDRYLVWVPTSGLLVLENNRDINIAKTWKPWDPAIIEGGLDMIESSVRGFGGGAANSPIFIPELQGGWFNHWTCPYTYDAIYNYYGHNYTRTLYDSCIAQGSTAISLYMGYGGTNWGTIGDPDVYTSYDYSACIREYGVLSGRGRLLRLSLSFMRSFGDITAATEMVMSGEPHSDINIAASPKRVLIARRAATNVLGAGLVVFRNFSNEQLANYELFVTLGKLPFFRLRGILTYKSSFISLVNYTSSNGLILVASTIPIHLRTHLDVPALGDRIEVWIIQNDGNASGEMAFRGAVTLAGSLGAIAKSELEGAVTVVSFRNQVGWASISNSMVSNKPSLYIIGLATHDLFTLVPIFDEPYFRQTGSDDFSPISVAWGATHISKNSTNSDWDVQYQTTDKALYVLSGEPVTGFENVPKSDPYNNVTFVWKRSLVIQSLVHSRPVLTNWMERMVDFESMNWHPLPFHENGKPTLDTLDLGYASGHVLYRARFTTMGKPLRDKILKMSLNMRHRCVVYANNVVVGGHLTYSVALMQPGSKQGADWEAWSNGAQVYDLTTYIKEGVNEVYVIVESFGFQRGPSVLYDFRNPRGILSAKFIGLPKSTGKVLWDVTGIDVKTLSNPYSSTGFPDENYTNNYQPALSLRQEGPGASSTTSIITAPSRYFAPRYYKCTFEAPTAPPNFRVPLRLCLEGPFTCYIFLNGVIIGRYLGEGQDCVQKDFYLQEGLVNVKGNEIKLLVYSRAVESKDVVMRFEIREWRAAVGSSLEDRWSFNLAEDGHPVILCRESFP
ncbi:beta-galactosidase [Synchytrium endobioticum]|uniref:Beta-galactosidase n=1 Tax=Synchytrium endobioticum TaxID=286115 RepID=A0A507D342_9FUNG|nr:beta-galactosidase [Synchytrium endobioticum]TPX45725.1 beta-galactosidase [Synchytrium endobioticum]